MNIAHERLKLFRVLFPKLIGMCDDQNESIDGDMDDSVARPEEPSMYYKTKVFKEWITNKIPFYLKKKEGPKGETQEEEDKHYSLLVDLSLKGGYNNLKIIKNRIIS